jgi:hypothetical protein
MTDFKTAFEELERVALSLGWSLAAGSKTQDEPEQVQLIITHEPRHKGAALGMFVSDKVLAQDFFGGVPDG